MIHSSYDETNGIHFPFSYRYADATAREAATGFVAADLYKFAIQTDNSSVWILSAVTPTWIEVTQFSLADGKIWVGNTSAVATAVTPSGDVAMTNAGAFTVTDLTLTSEAQGDVPYFDGTNWVVLTAKTDKQILIGDGTDLTSVAVSGDIAITNLGAVTVTDLTISSEAQGSILYFDGTNWVHLGFGTSGYYLKTQGTGANPIWAEVAAGGSAPGLTFFLKGGAYTGENIVYARLPVAIDLDKVQIAVTVAPTDASLIVDVNYHATDPTSLTTVFTTQASRPEIADAGTSDDSASPDVTALAAGGYVSVSVDQVGSTIAGTNLMVSLVPA